LRTISLSTAVALAIAAALAAQAQNAGRGWTIVGADMADGSGAPLRRANVRFLKDRIVAVGDVKPQKGDEEVDSKGLVVAPGFIDIHNHSSSGLADDPAAETQIAQGITTVVLGPDGDSPWPIGEYLSERRRAPSSVNVASLSGMPPCDGR
jgi:N-acyl-D-amino-acid deacylase